MLENREMGLEILGSSFSPFLCMGIMFATLENQEIFLY